MQSCGSDITILRGTPDAGLVDEPVEGTVNADGSISIDLFGELITSGDYTDYIWDVFNTSWAKQ